MILHFEVAETEMTGFTGRERGIGIETEKETGIVIGIATETGIADARTGAKPIQFAPESD